MLKNCKTLKEEIINEQLKTISMLKLRGVTPKLIIILIGNDKASETYVKNKILLGDKLGIAVTLVQLEKPSKEELIMLIKHYNKDKDTHGIIVQLPLSKHLQKYEREILDTINPLKDVDCLTTTNIGRLFVGKGEETLVKPCTPYGVMKLLEESNINIKGKLSVVFGRSEITGKPLGKLLQDKGSTVVNIHRDTLENHKENILKIADLVFLCTGQPHMFSTKYKQLLKPDVHIIDIGTTFKNGKLVGDLEPGYKEGYYTPTPGGTGQLTVVYLLENLLKLTLIQLNTKGVK